MILKITNHSMTKFLLKYKKKNSLINIHKILSLL